MKKFFGIAAVVFGVLVLSAIAFKDILYRQVFKPTQSSIATQSSTSAELVSSGSGIEIVAQDLAVPWEIAFLPDGSLLVTERDGRLLHILPNSRERITVDGVAHVGEGGLMGLALHPQFAENQWVYVYLTTRAGDGLMNRVERYRFSDNQLSDKTTILDAIPGAQYHDGGRIAFGPDGMLYIATGDAQKEALAQDTNSIAGKILRVRDDGSIPSDNPFGNAVYSYGHRNIQGLAWDGQGRLWSTEHGPSGLETGYDEVNLIERGANYGWPDVKGDQKRDGTTPPVIHSGKEETWAPAGMAIVDNSVFFTGLRGESLYQATIDGTGLRDLRAHLRSEYGRLRVVRVGPDGALYVATSNTDGRGEAKGGDDKIVKIPLENLK